MEKTIIKEICKNLKWYERIIVKMLASLFIKIYNNERVFLVNYIIKKVMQ